MSRRRQAEGAAALRMLDMHFVKAGMDGNATLANAESLFRHGVCPDCRNGRGARTEERIALSRRESSPVLVTNMGEGSFGPSISLYSEAFVAARTDAEREITLRPRSSATDIPGPQSAMFAQGQHPELGLCFSRERWAQLKKCKGPDRVRGYAIGVLAEDGVDRTGEPLNTFHEFYPKAAAARGRREAAAAERH